MSAALIIFTYLLLAVVAGRVARRRVLAEFGPPEDLFDEVTCTYLVIVVAAIWPVFLLLWLASRVMFGEVKR